jgi:copper transport protein
MRLAQPPAPGVERNTTAAFAVIEMAFFALSALSLRLRRPGWSGVWLCGVVLAEGIRAHPEGIVPAGGAALSYCHLLPALLWVGMLIYMLRAGIAWRADPEAVQGLIAHYSKAAGWLFALVVITGVISALVLVPLGSVLTTTYGRFLVAKASLVLIVSVLAIVGQVWLRRRPQPGAGPGLATKLEVGALVAVLAITGILTVLTPPAKPIRAQSSPPAQVLLIHREAVPNPART